MQPPAVSKEENPFQTIAVSIFFSNFAQNLLVWCALLIVVRYNRGSTPIFIFIMQESWLYISPKRWVCKVRPWSNCYTYVTPNTCYTYLIN